MPENLIFVSYRRADSAPIALALKMALERQLQAGQVFLDTHTIQSGDRFDREIELALRSAQLVIPVIGPDWEGRSAAGRRLDDPADWVRRELEITLRDKPDRILPVLIDGVVMPRAEALPPPLATLSLINPTRITVSEWPQDFERLLVILADKFGFVRKRSDWQYPRPDPIVARTIPVPWDDLNELTTRYMPEWSLEFSDDATRLDYKRIELARIFQFGSFKRAIAFVNAIADHAVRVDHHPQIETAWRTVKLSLSTWDAGHRVTALDVEFARAAERLFAAATKRDRKKP
jgi:pterin-4a-carbinolamine dehydratase